MVRILPRLQLVVLLVFCAVHVAACGGRRTAVNRGSTVSTSRGAAQHAGIEGLITLDDACPAARQVVRCQARPLIARVKVVDGSGRQVAMVQSDGAGRFRVGLEPGVYMLVPVNPRPNVPPTASPVTVTVVAGNFGVANVQYHSGVA